MSKGLKIIDWHTKAGKHILFKKSGGDKIEFGDKNVCPLHRLPHTLPVFGKLVQNEPCHTHKAKWRRLHHNTFCKAIKCPNYKEMRRKSEIALSEN